MKISWIILIVIFVVIISFFLALLEVSKEKRIVPADETRVERREDISIPKENETLFDETSASLGLVSPMNNFESRISLNGFGSEPSKIELSEEEYTDLVCKEGKHYPGFHTAVDLEVTKEERSEPVSVFSIYNGTVRQASLVNGYGGLIIIEYKIEGKIYSVYYGHVDLDTVIVKTGSEVKKGERIADLAPACSSKNGNTRKHLHFGIRKGSLIDFRGYVEDKDNLSNWIDPREIIK